MITDTWNDGEGGHLYFHHNGDFSGDLWINLPAGMVDGLDPNGDVGGADRLTAKIPFDAVKFIVATYVRRQCIVYSETATDDEMLLG
jgi:hypothetical protein